MLFLIKVGTHVFVHIHLSDTNSNTGKISNLVSCTNSFSFMLPLCISVPELCKR